ncbi:MAG TPA: SpoIIIAC/SpoIIIAD family protein [Oscillospiraceae bacterium]|mgnify:FL=1|nr:SpoIIIAC/SpoIIIAD family protein [Oscillospiraceae bacterium]HPS35219.1 SpoIIIAC/SpoIIIAD family protein [Oscillospiraceae bacterium]
MSIDIITVALLGMATAVICVILKQYKPEFSAALAIGFSVILLLYLLSKINPIVKALETLATQSGIPTEFFSAVTKALGISILVGLSCDSCTDAGQNSLASNIELAGKIAIVLLCIPLIGEIVEVVKKLLV